MVRAKENRVTKIQLLYDSSDVDWERISQLFVAVGWGVRSVPQIKLAFSKSSFQVFAYCNEELIGFGRTTDDGVNYAMICDLVVDPRFHGRGIGSQLLTYLRDACSEFRFLTLTTAEGKDGFYLGQGWKRQSSSFIWPRDEKQSRIHAS